jgi:hypothetical protein
MSGVYTKMHGWTLPKILISLGTNRSTERYYLAGSVAFVKSVEPVSIATKVKAAFATSSICDRIAFAAWGL